MIIYWGLVFILFILFLLYMLCYFNLIFKGSKFQSLIKSTYAILIIKRILSAILTLFIITLFIFFITEIMPKNYFYKAIPSEEKSLFLESSMFQRLKEYYYNILPFPKKVCSAYSLNENNLECSSYKYILVDLGKSYTFMKNISVISIIKEKSLVSFVVGIIAYILQCLIGYPLGIYIARKENKLADKSVGLLYNFINIIPSAIYFYLFILLFMIVFKLPVMFEFNNILSYIAPVSAIALSSSLSIAYFVKKYILLELNKDYVKFARSKGLNENVIFYKHVLKNAFVPLIRTIPSSIAVCFSGFFFLESCFNIPGMDLTLIHAIRLHDVYLIRGLILFLCTLSVIAFLIGDVLTIVLKRKKDLVKRGDFNEN